MMERTALLEMKNISKSFPGVRALDHVNLKVEKGEVHILVGENGAGKSTLIKILCGLHTDYEGEIVIEGEKVSLKDPHDALKYGIATIHQELNQVPTMTIAENLFLGREPLGRGNMLIDDKRIYKEAKAILEAQGLTYDPHMLVRNLTVSQMQMIEIAKSVSQNARIIIMDEPTSAITDAEVKVLFQCIKRLKAEGVGIIYISHRLEEMFEIGDKVTILRDGQYIDTKDVKDVTRGDIIKMMVGRELNNIYPEKKHKVTDKVVLEVKNLTGHKRFENISFKLHAGEILGLAGLMGAGRTEIARALFGLDPIHSGEVYLEGKRIAIKNTSDAMKHGIMMATEDRKRYGLVLKATIGENIGLPNLKQFLGKSGFLLSDKREREKEKEVFDELGVKAPSMHTRASALSGGNQQKVVLAKWILANPKVFILDEPTRGIDVGAKYEIYKIMTELASKGMAIIMISSELPEVIGMCDRVIVMREHYLSGEVSGEEINQEYIMEFASANVEELRKANAR